MSVDGGTRALNKEKEASLAGIRLLENVSAAKIQEIEKACAWRHYDANEQIIDRQSDTREVFFVIDGRVRIAIYSIQGREITLDDLTPGDHFGELAAIDSEPRSASVTAITACYLASLSADRFLDLCASEPDVSFHLMRSLSHIVRMTTDRVMDLSTLAANNRVHAEILRQAKLNMSGENAAEISPIPVHSDIASRVSTTRETVARVMNDLAREGLVERQKKALLVHDVERLEDMVEDVRG